MSRKAVVGHSLEQTVLGDGRKHRFDELQAKVLLSRVRHPGT
jgi:hypothetical protein